MKTVGSMQCGRRDTPPDSGRRRVLAGLLGAVAAVALPSGPSVANPGGNPRWRVEALGRRLVLLAGAKGNAVALRGGDGVLLVDGGDAAGADALLEQVGAFANGAAVHTLINTHWHREHTGCNDALGRAGARIVAHENTRLWLGTVIERDWDGGRFEPLPEHARPNDTFRTEGALDAGGARVEYAHLLQSHTDGDIYVRFPAENVVVAGGVAATGRYPIIDHSTGAWLAGMLDGVHTLLELCDADTRIVPEVGPVMTRAQLQAQYDMLATMRERIVDGMRRSLGPQDMLAEGVAEGFQERWGDPALFVNNAYEGFLMHLRYSGIGGA